MGGIAMTESGPVLIVLLVVVLFLGAWIMGNFNALIRLRNHVRDSWAGIDTELKRRHDLIPNLVETVKGYAAHEEGVIVKVVEARARAERDDNSPCVQAREENFLLDSLGSMMALSEDYPDLKADKHFLKLQEELISTEDRIQSARRFYNANVRSLNNRVEMFPSSIIANAMGVGVADFFEIDSLARSLPQVRMREDR